MIRPPAPVLDQSAWDAILRRLPHSHTLQSWPWGDFKSRWGWLPVRLAWLSDDGTPVAAAQILRRPIPRTPWSMLYAPKGPVWDYTRLPLVKQVTADLATYAHKQRAIFIKIDPDVPLAYGDDADFTIHPSGQAVKNWLKSQGWQYSPQQIQFKNTVLIDLHSNNDDLLAGMKSKWRYNIRLAGRRGVTVRRAGPEALDTFYELYALTGERDNFLIRPRAYYLDVWRNWLQATPPTAAMLLAEYQGRPIAGLMLFFQGQTAWYMYGASDNALRNLMPNHLLQWEAIQLAKKQGCTRYDLWGAPDVFNELDSMWGVYKFKVGFGGQTRQGLGAYDFPLFPLKYWAYMRLLPQLLTWLKR